MSNYQTADREGHGLGYTILHMERLLGEARREVERLRHHLTEIEQMAAKHEESAEWQASAAIPAILGRARRALRGDSE